ncbi:MAG: hypothetical protein PHU68_03085, partial [Paludibacter sp.]|nr:hypothetical protein [Paludibacter sp.]
MNYSAFFLVSLFLVLQSSFVSAQPQNIKNNAFWNTVDGQPIYSQGGGVFRFTDPQSGAELYYWYGVNYKEAALYRNDPSVTQPRDHFESVTCYTSTDLVNWKSQGDVLTREELDRNYSRTGWVGRLGV